MREFDLPVLDRSEGEWTIYDLPQIALPYSAPFRGFFFCNCEMEAWDDELNRVEVLIRSDGSGDIRMRLTAAAERISNHLASVGLITTSVTPREIGAHSADAIIFVCEIQ